MTDNFDLMKPCPEKCPGGMRFNENTGDLDSECLVCKGYAFVWEDGTVINSKPERANPFEYTTDAD